ncbi:MAG: hypothetical protein KDA84_14635 [Planctomycetaceae bacterium]|nr:hypothetical protein [Planctomycetaceae bacterium]
MAKRSLLNWIALFAFLIGGATRPVLADEEYSLEESPTNGLVYRVSAEVDVRGKLQTTASKEKTLDLDLAVEASFDYRERRLPGAGRDAEALRSLRQYRQAQAAITVNKNRSFSSLSNADTMIVAHGNRPGITFYQPSEFLTRNELELLQMPGDALAVLGLLPQTKVEVGQKWTVETWAAQMLTGTEALLKSDVSCELDYVRNNTAKVRIQGSVEGAIQGATTKIELSGYYLFDTDRNYLRSVELKQTEKRGVGAVSPGMDVVATVKIDRSPTTDAGQVTQAATEKIPLEPKAEELQLLLQLPWNASVSHSRDWHVFQRTQHLTVLRLVKGGSLIAQCNLSPLAERNDNQPIRESEFRELVKKGLGDRLKSIVSSHAVPTDSETKLLRIVAKGESQKIDMTWHYYLATAQGRQMLFFVAFESDLKEQLDEADLKLVKTLRMQKPKLIPASGEK